MKTDESLLPLGKPVEYVSEHAPDLLHPIPRAHARGTLGIVGELPFSGVDVWHAYEVSWLNEKGKPVVATAELRFPASSPNMIESKSLKLYLMSLNGTRYESREIVRSLVESDLAERAGAAVGVDLFAADTPQAPQLSELPGASIDDADSTISDYDLNPQLLSGSAQEGAELEETLHSHLLKSNCPITGQPDWASIVVRYRGRRIERAKLLAYLVSYRNHSEFHEHCVERIFTDIQRHCAPAALTVHAFYTRRGGLDINPYRSDFEREPRRMRVWRQ